MNTEIFKNYKSFKKRGNKDINGVSQRFLDKNRWEPSPLMQDSSNTGCWNCLNCEDCKKCRSCKNCTGCKRCAHCILCVKCKNCLGCKVCHSVTHSTFCDTMYNVSHYELNVLRIDPNTFTANGWR